MARTFQSFANSSPSRQKDAYIYKIVACAGDSIGAITSADELFLIDSSTLGATPASRLSSPPSQLSSLISANDGQMLICAGGDDVYLYDVRSRNQAGSFKAGKAVTALACSGSSLAVGTEYANHQAIVSVWDLRQPAATQWQNAENHDDITAIDFRPGETSTVLAGGDDGQVSIFDSRIAEEQDSLVQGFNHGPIHKAGFLDLETIYALSSDQDLALHPVYDDAREEEPQPLQLGDLRPKIPCEYVIDILRASGDSIIAAGSHSKSQVDVVRLTAGGSLDLNNRIVLQGAHGEEIVRSVLINDMENVIFTAGEDGKIQAFRSGGGLQNTPKSSSKAKKGSEGRYKPY